MAATPDDIATTLALVIQRLDQIDSKLDASTHDHESRLRKLEQWSYTLPVSLVMAVCSIVFAILNHK